MSVKYTADHEWVKLEADDVVLIGITNHAQEQLGDVVFVELPEIDSAFGQGDDISGIESVKAASELNAPVRGSIVAVNDVLSDEPNIVNDDPMEAGWFCRMKLSDPSELDALLDEDAYNATLD
jgi:glycine cleavage system H protein